MKTVIPPKLKSGSHVRIVAPSCTLPSIPWLTEEPWGRMVEYFSKRGITLSESAHLREMDSFGSTSIENRVKDIHDAFRDPTIDALLCIRGGWNSNQLLPYLDYDLIRSHPKILCGFSDITAIANAITAKTGLVTYSGPNINQFSFGEKIQYTYEYFDAALLSELPIDVTCAKEWADPCFDEKESWSFEKNDGWWVVHEGEAKGTSIGGNLCTLSLLQGTEYMPREPQSILFIEDDHETHPRTFNRDLTSLTQQPWFSGVQGILFGRFQKVAVNKEFGPVTKEFLFTIIADNPKLKNIPIIANVDFGHTHPIFTFPIGGTVEMKVKKDAPKMRILEH